MTDRLNELALEAIAIARRIPNLARELAEAARVSPGENPGIARISKSAFAISSASLDGNITLSPFTYDWPRQADFISVQISKCLQTPKTTITVLSEILEKGVSSQEQPPRRFSGELVDKLRPTMELVVDMLKGMDVDMNQFTREKMGKVAAHFARTRVEPLGETEDLGTAGVCWRFGAVATGEDRPTEPLVRLTVSPYGGLHAVVDEGGPSERHVRTHLADLPEEVFQSAAPDKNEPERVENHPRTLMRR